MAQLKIGAGTSFEVYSKKIYFVEKMRIGTI